MLPAGLRNDERLRDTTCSSTIPGCETTGDACFSSADCTGGAVCAGNRTCGRTGVLCTGDADCNDVCEFPNGMGGLGTTGTCSVSNITCSDNSDCVFNGDSCGAGFCSCNNPNFDPFDPICTDEDCDDVCTLVCENRMCVEDDSCESNADCVAGDRNICSDDLDACVECEANSDCDDPDDEEDDDHECNQETGTCFQPCRGDSECGQFQECQEDGTCEFVGCRTDQECILLGLNAGVDDQRLLRCVQDEEGIGTCSIQCEIDAHCPGTHVCDSGSCKYIGCQADSDCYSLMGLNDWQRTTTTPWTPEAVCSDETPEGIEL